MGFLDFLFKLFGPKPVTAELPQPTLLVVDMKHQAETGPVALPADHPTFYPASAIAASSQHGVGIRVDHLTALGVNKDIALKHCGFLNEACERFEINNNARICAFIAQTCEESGYFTSTMENLNYSASRLCQVWPQRFPSLDLAQKVAGEGPEGVANSVYGNRFGNTQPGDGWKYRGRGFVQLTFKGNYEASSEGCGIDFVANPELVAMPEYCSLTAAEYWKRNGLNELCAPDNEDAVRRVTQRINGGQTNTLTRVAIWKKAEQVFVDIK